MFMGIRIGVSLVWFVLVGDFKGFFFHTYKIERFIYYYLHILYCKQINPINGGYDNMTELPTAPIERILKRNANNMKISKEAKQMLLQELEKEAVKISKTAVKLAKEDGRKTVQAKDIMKWKTYEETDGEDYVYKINDIIYYNKYMRSSVWKNIDELKIIPRKFLSGKLLFLGKLHDAKSLSEAKRLMGSYEQEILDSLMEPHWAYNIYSFRDWEPVREMDNGVKILSMWFDDYDAGDTFFEGFLFP